MHPIRLSFNSLPPRAVAVAAAAVVAHALLFLFPTLPLVQSSAAFILLIAAPGLLLASLLVDDTQEPLPVSEWLSYGIGGGFGLATLLVLTLGLLPGPLSRPLLLAGCDGLILLLLALLWRQGKRRARRRTPQNSAPSWRWALAVGLILLLAAGLRLTNLGYSQLQGDEATPIVRAAAFVQDGEDAVFAQPRGPLDTLIPAGIMVLGHSVTELALRLPFALAALVAVLAVLRLGTLLARPAVGWLAALLFALDGYAIAFGRVMHYESVIVLVTAAAVLALWRAVTRQRALPTIEPAALRPYFWVAALLTAAGLLAHYDALLILLPGAYLLFVLWRGGMSLRDLLRCTLGPAALLLALTVPFYAAFVLSPHFAETLAHYSQTLVEDSGLLVNSLLYFAESTALYYGAVGFYVNAAVLWLAAWLVFWSRPRLRLAVIPLALVAGLPLVLAAPTAFGLPDPLPALWIAAIGAAILVAPTVTTAERLLWLWLGAPLFVALFLVETPGLHFYVISTALALLVAMTIYRVYAGLAPRLSPPAARRLALAGLTGLIFLVAINTVHLFGFFISGSEVAMNTKAERRAPWLWPLPTLTSTPLYYGAPYNAGWQTVGSLWNEGRFQGSYRSNIDRWITNWYLRGAESCRTQPDYIIIDPFSEPASAGRLQDELGNAYHLQVEITNRQEPRLLVYGRERVAEVQNIDLATAEPAAKPVAQGYLPITPLAGPAPAEPLLVRFGDSLELTSARIEVPLMAGSEPTRLAAGDAASVSLAWRLLQPVGGDYKVSLQLLDAATRKAGQRDAMLACGAGSTAKWDVGETEIGYYQVRATPDAQAGEYSLMMVVYDAATQEPLPAYDANGVPLGDLVPLRAVRVE